MTISRCGCGLAVDEKLDLAPTGVAKGIAHNLGDRGGDAGLFAGIETKQGGNVSGALARGHDVLIVPNEESEKGGAAGGHGSAYPA